MSICETCWKSFKWQCPLSGHILKNMITCSAYDSTDVYLKEQELTLEFLKDWRWIFNIVINKDKIISTEDIEKLHKLDKKWKKRKDKLNDKKLDEIPSCLICRKSVVDYFCINCEGKVFTNAHHILLRGYLNHDNPVKEIKRILMSDGEKCVCMSEEWQECPVHPNPIDKIPSKEPKDCSECEFFGENGEHLKSGKAHFPSLCEKDLYWSICGGKQGNKKRIRKI